MRVGPSRLISTAESSGESNDTAAAEWMTMSHDGEHGPVGLRQPEAVGADVAGDRRDPPRRHLVERLAAAAHSARRRSKASFFSSSRCTRRAAGVRLPSRTSSTSSQSGTERSSRSTSAVPTNPVDPVMAIRVRAERLGDHGAMSSTSLYQLVESRRCHVPCPRDLGADRRQSQPARHRRSASVTRRLVAVDGPRATDAVDQLGASARSGGSWLSATVADEAEVAVDAGAAHGGARSARARGRAVCTSPSAPSEQSPAEPRSRADAGAGATAPSGSTATKSM